MNTTIISEKLYSCQNINEVLLYLPHIQRLFATSLIISITVEYNFSFLQRGSCMVWEINMGVCPRLDFENIMLFNCLGYNFNIYGAFEFLCNSIADL